MQVGVGLLVSDMMPIYMIIALNIVIAMRFSINCPTVICLPTVCYVFEREASSENYGPPGLLLSYIKIQKYLAAIYLLLFSFAIYFYIYHY